MVAQRANEHSVVVCIVLASATTVMFLLLPMALHSQESSGKQAAESAEAVIKSEQAVENSNPVHVYRSYLNAIKANDLSKAKSCCWLPGDDTSALDVIAGMWVAYHRFNTATARAGIGAWQFGERFTRDDCTDAALDRTLARLEQSEVTIKSDTATLKIRWDKDDGSPSRVFWYGVNPIPFRKTATGWRIDALAICGTRQAKDFSTEGGWGGMARKHTEMMNEIAAGLESGKLKTATDVVRELEKHVGNLEGRIPLTQTVIYQEDSPTRYLRIEKGDPNVGSLGPQRIPHRNDRQHLRHVEGNLRRVFTEMYGVDHPRIVVETSNKKGYNVVFDPHDPRALEIAASQLGMTVGEEDREILALQLTVAQNGHRLKQVKKPDRPQWEASVTGHGVWPLHGVTMDELVLFLESRIRRPVVNMTGLDGYYWLELSGDAVHFWPQKMDETKFLDQTGLLLSWKPTTARVLVVKDK